MEIKDYPSLYIAAEKASRKAQNYYTRLTMIDLIFISTAALSAIYNIDGKYGKTVIYCISGLSLAIGIFITLIIKWRGYENTWYKSRALAESIKTLTWRFITCAEGFESCKPYKEVIATFKDKILQLQSKFEDLSLTALTNSSTGFVTYKMSTLRKENINDRKNHYLINRISEQENWYKNKAVINQICYDRWFFIMIASKLLSLISIALLLTNPTMNWKLVGFFTTVSAAVLSWIQLKQYQTLIRAYSTAANELEAIRSLSESIETDDDFSKFVLDAENAISKEHTLWLVQRRR